MPVGATQDQTATFRADIQALRGVAILLVVLHHTRLGFLNAGYLGVDIFFTVSGYLITRIIQKDIELRVFSFSKFYFRRAKRLLPAAYVAFLLTALVSGIFLTSAEQRDFTKQLIGAVTFTGNIVLWLQTGYFEGAAELKPLLHVWSLGIEEQYYLLLPAAFVFFPRRLWISGTGMLLLASLCLCIALAPLRAGAAFYLLPTRGWELAAGSMGALALDGPTTVKRLSFVFWPALLSLFMVPIFSIGNSHPGLDAIIVCAATLVIILRRHPMLEDNSVIFILAAVGEFSYSLYLVHWPIFAFANNAYVSAVPTGIRIALVALALIIGYALYRCVELPMRRLEIASPRKYVAGGIVASLVLIGVAMLVAKLQTPDVDYPYLRRNNVGFGASCEYEEIFSAKSECQNLPRPEIMVWGDSYAMHLVPGIAATTKLGVIQATKAVCGPFLDMVAYNETEFQRPWAASCLQFNRSVFDYLARASSIKIVVLSSPFVQYVGGSDWGRGFRTLHEVNGKLVAGDRTVLSAIESMRYTVDRLRAIGKRVVVVAPPPSSDFDVGSCLERKATGKLILGTDNKDCRISVESYVKSQAAVLQFLNRLPKEAGVNVVRFDGLLCSRQFCETQLNGVFIYRDSGHFTNSGSREVAKKMQLSRVLLDRAM